MAQVTTYTGTAASCRAEAIQRHLINAPASTRLIVPTQRAVQQRMRQVLKENPECSGFLGRPIMTFQDFAAGLLEGSDDSFPLVSATTQQLLLKRSIQLTQETGMLDFLGEASERPGFVHHVQRLIAQFKQEAMVPLKFRETIAHRSHPSPFDHAVVEIYTNYQNLLLASKTFDLQGMYWLADLACQHKIPAALEGIDTLLIDGFDDFTPSEFRLIQSVDAHLEALIFGLNYDIAPSRRDAYALVRATYKHIQKSFDASAKDFEGEVAPPATQCQYVSRKLFWRDSTELKTLPTNLAANLRCTPCRTITHEIETIARDIKRRVVHEGVELSDILIVLKQPESYTHTLAKVFEEAGIPLRLPQSMTLAQSSLADFMLKLYESSALWERDAMVHLLTSSLFQSMAQSPPEHVHTYNHIAHRAEILEGATQWSARLDHFSGRLSKRNDRQVDAWLQHIPHLSEACVSLIQDVERLKNLAESIPGSALFSEHIQALQGVFESLSLEAVLAFQRPETREREFHAWAAFKALMHEITQTAKLMQTTLSRVEFIAQLQDLYALASLPEASIPGGVLCLGLDDARHIQRPYVYAAGINEGSMPAPPPVNAIYTQFDQHDLAKVGIRMPSQKEHAEKERLQFLRLFSIPTQQLTITWHESSQQGQTLYPSPFVQDVLDLFRSKGESESILIHHVPETAMNVREAVNASVGEKGALLDALSDTVKNTLAKVGIEKSRYASGAFNAFDGVLSEPLLIEKIAAHYNTQHLFSAHQIETYIDCPFRFMMRSMLNLSERETPALDFDRRIMGIIYHNALEQFYTHYTGQLLEETTLSEALSTLERIATEVFEKTVGAFAQTYPGIAQVEQARILKTLKQHIECHHRNGSEGWRPSHAEVTFGEALHSGSDSLSKADHFALGLGEQGEEYLFTGRIDRVDLNEAGAARIVDYKSSLGSIAEKDIKEGRNIQSTLYAMALEQVLIPGKTCSEAIYLKIGGDETRGNPKRDKGDPRASAHTSIAAAIHAIQAGIFHPKAHEKSCKYCPKNKVCRFEEGRIAGKTPR